MILVCPTPVPCFLVCFDFSISGDQSTLEISSTPRYGGSGGESEKKERVKLEQFELAAEGLVGGGGGGGGVEGWMAVERKGREICSYFKFFSLFCYELALFFIYVFIIKFAT